MLERAKNLEFEAAARSARSAGCVEAKAVWGLILKHFFGIDSSGL